MVQINLGSSVLRKLPEINYEHYLKSSRLGLSLSLGYRLPKRRAFLSSSTLIVNGDTNLLANRVLDGFRITPEIKFYLSKNAKEKPVGFYVSGFMRYYNYRMNSELKRSVDGDLKEMQINAQITNVAFGLAIGSRYILDHNFTIDVLWLGVGYGFGKTNFKLRSTDATINWNSLENDFVEAELRFMKNSNRKVLSNGMDVNTFNPFSLVLRSSFSLGFVF